MKLPAPTQVSIEDLAKRIYVGNLYYDMKEPDIRNAFAPFGSIHSIDLSMEPG
jgi:RNA recognition motif-containing protein